uniref:Uncharacterized protein n=1 Tax=Anguilla anguilla TaxID=7936 RepID=A0A0E9QXV3_ANGAN
MKNFLSFLDSHLDYASVQLRFFSGNILLAVSFFIFIEIELSSGYINLKEDRNQPSPQDSH